MTEIPPPTKAQNARLKRAMDKAQDALGGQYSELEKVVKWGVDAIDLNERKLGRFFHYIEKRWIISFVLRNQDYPDGLADKILELIEANEDILCLRKNKTL